MRHDSVGGDASSSSSESTERRQQEVSYTCMYDQSQSCVIIAASDVCIIIILYLVNVLAEYRTAKAKYTFGCNT